MEMNEFNFFVLWIANEGKERNIITSCLYREKKRNKKNVIYIVNKIKLNLELWIIIH